MSPLADVRPRSSLLALRRHTAPVRRWQTTAVMVPPNLPVLVSGADARRAGVAIQVPSGLAVWVGPDETAASSAQAQEPAFPMVAGSGIAFGPENRLDIFLVHGASTPQDIRVLETFTAAADA